MYSLLLLSVVSGSSIFCRSSYNNLGRFLCENKASVFVSYFRREKYRITAASACLEICRATVINYVRASEYRTEEILRSS